MFEHETISSDLTAPKSPDRIIPSRKSWEEGNTEETFAMIDGETEKASCPECLRHTQEQKNVN